MEINDSLHIFKDSISTEISDYVRNLELNFVKECLLYFDVSAKARRFKTIVWSIGQCKNELYVDNFSLNVLLLVFSKEFLYQINNEFNCNVTCNTVIMKNL